MKLVQSIKLILQSKDRLNILLQTIQFRTILEGSIYVIICKAAIS